jgi:hypothetical protein
MWFRKKPAQLVALHGTGDTYLVCGLASAFKEQHGTLPLVVLKRSHVAIAQMFDVAHRVDDALVQRAETDQRFQRNYENALLGVKPFYCHPSFVRSNVRIDHLALKPSVSHADMYRVMLQLPPDAPVQVGRTPERMPRPNTVLLIPKARSWPNLHVSFWRTLADMLSQSGRQVQIGDDAWSLSQLFDRCAESEWVIGPQCGVMAIICYAQFACRKTFVTPAIEEAQSFGLPLHSTFPYAYVSKFAGNDYDVEEFKIARDNQAEVLDAVINGANARQLWPHDPAPTMNVHVPLTPGEFLDRLAVLTVKHRRFEPRLRAGIDREHRRHLEVFKSERFTDEALKLFSALIELHGRNFDAHERFVRTAVANEAVAAEDHATAVRANKDRVMLKRRIDALSHAPYMEVKSYYGKEGTER